MLEDVRHLRKLVLDNRADASVLHFKVLQILNFFSDTVRDTTKYLDELSRNAGKPQYLVSSAYSSPFHQETEEILKHNWDIVLERQQEASSRILDKLARTTNEVKRLQNGVSCLKL